MIKKIKSLIIQISIFLKFDLRMIFLKKFSKKLYDDRREWLKQGGVIHYNYPIKRDEVLKFGNKWKPYRSVATWYLWRSLDPIPVEY